MEMNTSTIERLQNWYMSMCNGDWEHTYGVHVETLDNPGWHVKIDLRDTDMEDISFPVVEYGVGKDSQPDNNDWLTCKVENKTFHGYGGPEKLCEIFRYFLDWDDKNREQRH
jgi:hypothetical protein